MHLADRPSILVPVGAKGGTLKTSIVEALGFLFATLGYHVVLVDADPQASLTQASAHPRVPDPLAGAFVERAYHLPANGHGERLSIATAGSVRLLPGGRNLEGASPAAISMLIRRAASPVTGPVPNVVLIDTPPSLGPITQEAMRHADLILLPTDPTSIAVRGAADVVLLHQQLGLRAPLRVILTKVSGHTRDLNEMVRAAVDTEPPFAAMPGLRLPVEIPFTRNGAVAGTYCLPVTVTAPDDRAAQAYRKLLRSVGDTLGVHLPRTVPRARLVP